MRYTFIFAMLLIFLGTSAQKIAYYLPKKIIYVTVPFNIVEKRLFKVDHLTGQLEKDPVNAVTTVKINGDIKVESKLFPGAIKSLDLDLLGKGGKSFNFDINFDEKGNGMISSINASQTPVTADIIKGTVSIVGSVIKLAAGVYGAAGGDKQPEFQEITTEQNIEETRVIELTNSDPFSLIIEPSTRVNNIAGTKPSVEVKITKIAQEAGASNISKSSNPGIELHYRIPAEHSLQVIIKNNQLIKEQVVINERILVPQTGSETTLLIPILKKKKTVDIGFDKETGNLSKYGLKKESQLSENTEAISNAIGTLNTEISGLKTALEAKKEKEEADKKKVEEENRNKDIKDEIAHQNLEKEKLDLIVELQKLKEEIDAKKKEAKAKKTP
jgi:hypothetical protein